MPKAECENTKCKQVIESGNAIEFMKRLSLHYFGKPDNPKSDHYCYKFIYDDDPYHVIVFAGGKWVEFRYDKQVARGKMILE